MTTKAQEIADPNSCWNKIAPDEPIFILRAQDLAAAGTVRRWASAAGAHGAAEKKTKAALHLADEMDRWPNRKVPD